jgi:hypothetical protein
VPWARSSSWVALCKLRSSAPPPQNGYSAEFEVSVRFCERWPQGGEARVHLESANAVGAVGTQQALRTGSALPPDGRGERAGTWLPKQRGTPVHQRPSEHSVLDRMGLARRRLGDA